MKLTFTFNVEAARRDGRAIGPSTPDLVAEIFALVRERVKGTVFDAGGLSYTVEFVEVRARDAAVASKREVLTPERAAPRRRIPGKRSGAGR